MIRSEVAARVCVASMANDLGNSEGRLRVLAARFEIRRVLFMAPLTAARHRPAIKGIYDYIKAAGKLPMATLQACMRE